MPEKLTKYLSVLMLTIAATFASFQASADDGKVYTLKYHHSYPPTLAYYKTTGQGFIELVERWSNGRIKFQVFDAGALASVPEMLSAVDKGIIDVSHSWGGFYSGTVPEADVEVGLPLAWQEPWEAYDAYYNRGLGEVVSEAYESKFNVKHFPAIMGLKYGISTRQDINSLDDLKGLKIRAIGLFGKIATNLGASAVSIPGAEIFSSLQLGTIDGLVYGVEAVVAQKLQGELKTTIFEPNLNSGVGHWLINRTTWESLPEDLQQVINDAVRYGNSAHALDYAASEAVSTGAMEKAGVKLLALSPEDRKTLQGAVLPLWDEIAAKSDLAAKAVEIVKQQQRDYGQMQ
ncbi:MAG: hypothetical protein CMN55_01670 [Sneathiella sp.]|jgi:TRAP-type C4-dicarboxylate transport system substrate-binding protein|uniref:TRAP transporter substrate-binding protein DctP n=1 Tax=Sneathiella sp. TaxID=1964365 RepID=UPI000C3916DB|nr:TRAP transporter substrate-binding protein DctP [Sneathiella sp.]MAL77810.1 hypothetical protein [Sneathiella sp.]|tara:strand:- start:293 stop:1330 length:1038 start_codon:yes stop_codon:yes gene_type:complete